MKTLLPFRLLGRLTSLRGPPSPTINFHQHPMGGRSLKLVWHDEAGGVCQVPQYMLLSDEIGS